MTEKAVLFALTICWLAAGSTAQDRPAPGAELGRSPVLATRGMVATSQPLAAAAGLRVLQDGGNAIDAAIATAAVLNVVEPMMCGIGGDLFALVYENESQKLYGLNATGRAGSKSSAQWMRDEGYERMPSSGIYAVTVPGAVDGWEQLLARFGTRSLAELLEPAIHYAEHGFPVSEIIATDWQGLEGKLSRHPEAAANYLIDGRAPRHGELFKSPDLAQTFRQLADEGPQAFYRGSIAHKIANFVDSEGGFVTYEDMANHHSEWVEPISTTYKDVTLYQIPPNSQGYVALEMLNILEAFDLKSLGHNSAEYLHLLIEAKKLAFADRDAYLTDPSQADVPLEKLISKEYAAERRKLIDRARAASEVAPADIDPTETVYLTVVDADRNVVSLIYSVYGGFGSGLVVPGTGITAPKPRHRLFVATGPSQRARTGQTRAPHEHARHGVQGQKALAELRGHGRRHAAARTHASASQHARVRDERTGSGRGTALSSLLRQERRVRVGLRHRRLATAHPQRPPADDPHGFLRRLSSHHDRLGAIGVDGRIGRA